jgi:polar amino acid transport system substrate-binding protein
MKDYMFKISKFLINISTYFFVLPLILLSQNTYSKSLKIETLDVFPFGYTNSEGRSTGLIFDISNKIAETAGYQFTNVLIPYPRLIIDLKYGLADFTIRYSSDELNVVSIPHDKIISFQTIIIGQVNSKYTKLENLHGKIVGTIRSAHFDDDFDNDKKIIKQDFITYEQSLKMLTLKRIDAVIGSDIGLYETIKKLNLAPKKFGSPLKLQRKYFILHFSKKTYNEKVAKDIKNAVKKLKSTYEFEKIIKSYQFNKK